MYQEEKNFTVRFCLEAHFPEDYEGEDDAYVWLHDWETRVMPDLLKSIFTSLRRFPSWSAHVRNRGVASTEEIEVSLVKDYSKPMTQ